MPAVAIFQNYYTPYRHALFERLVEDGVDLTVLYAQRPADEGRAWAPPASTAYAAIYCPGLRVGRVALFGAPAAPLIRRKYDLIVLLDNNPTNLAMIFHAALARAFGNRNLLWVEHVPDIEKGWAKRTYQELCTRILAALSCGILPFSTRTERYLDALRVTKPRYRMLQATPRPSGAAPVGTPEGAVTRFGYLGSDAPRKNVAALVEAFRASPRPDIRLVVAGFDASAIAAGDKRIVSWSYVDGERREAFFREIDMLLLPSLAEPWGLVVNEALQRGALAAISDRCGSTDIVGRISPRLIFAPDVAGISGLIDWAVGLPAAEVQKLRAAGAAAADAYSITQASRRMLAAFQAANR